MKGAAASSSDDAASAARTTLEKGGSAVDAVLSGFFAIAGADASGLLAPTSVLVFGVGAGARAFDGRSLQPGLGAPRPRGILSGQSSSEASKVSVPRSLRLVALLHSLHGRRPLSDAVKHGVSAAKAAGATERAALIGDVGDVGAGALDRSRVRELLFAVSNAAVGGALSPDDLEEALPHEVAVTAQSIDGAPTFRVPWGSQPGQASPSSRTSVIAAVDPWGLVALLSLERGHSLVVPGLGVGLPLSGIPVRRGVPRTAPGTALPAPAPLAVIDRGSDLRLAAAVALTENASSRILHPRDLGPLCTATPIEEGARELKARFEGLVVVAVEKKGARVIAASDAAA